MNYYFKMLILSLFIFLFPRNVFGVLNWCDYNEFGWTVALRKQVPRWVHEVFYEQVCNGSDWEYTLKDKDSADGWLDSRCSVENVPVSSPNVTALSNFRDRVTRAVIDRLSWPLHPLFYDDQVKDRSLGGTQYPGTVPSHREPELELWGRVTPSARSASLLVLGVFKRASEWICRVCVLSVVH